MSDLDYSDRSSFVAIDPAAEDILACLGCGLVTTAGAVSLHLHTALHALLDRIDVDDGERLQYFTPGEPGCGFCLHPRHDGPCSEQVIALGIGAPCGCTADETFDDLHPGSLACERCDAENHERFVRSPVVCPHMRDIAAQVLGGRWGDVGRDTGAAEGP